MFDCLVTSQLLVVYGFFVHVYIMYT